MTRRIVVAGELGIDIDGVAVDMSPLGRLGRLFWAFLVCERHRAVARDELAEVLWGDDELPKSWEQMLRGNASKLRAALAAASPDPGIEVVSAFGAYQVRLPVDAVVDIDEAAAQVEQAVITLRSSEAEEAFVAAAAAVAVAARGFLPGWSGTWVERRQAELRELQLRALEVVGDAACVRHRWADAIAAAEQAIGVEPFRESAYQVLMAAHRGAGNAGEALRAYERCRRVLSEELGVSPSAATEAAYLAALNDEASPADEVALLPLPLALAPGHGGFLVGRKAETDRLNAALERATTHGRQAVLVGGEPGVGKTALVADFARDAHAGGTKVLYGRCDEELGVAYQPFAEALGHYVAHCPLPELSAHVAAHNAELSRITPELLRRLPDAPPPVVTGSDGDRYRLFEATTALLHQASRRGSLVLVLDDLHWAAAPTLTLLRHLLRSHPSSLLVVGMYRHTEVGPDHPLTATLADLRREPGVERMVLEGLDEEGVSAFIEQSESPPLDAPVLSLAQALHARTHGNPFFVGEFLRHLAESGAVYRRSGTWSYYEDAEGLGLPEGVRDVVARRLGRLSEPANRALTVASVVGLAFDLRLIERLIGPAASDTALDALDEAVAAHVIAELEPGRYQFAHALVRDTIYSALTATRRARLHHRVGDALASLPGDPGPRLPALAHHFAEAASDGTAVEAGEYALAAARQAFSGASWDDAVAFVKLGLDVLSPTDPEHLERRFDLLILEIEAQFVMVRIGLAIAAMRQAIETARLLGSSERLARAVTLYLLSEGAAAPDVIELAEEALRGLGDSEPALRARVLAGLAVCKPRRLAGRSDPETRAALALARETGDKNAIHAALVARRMFLCNSPYADDWLAVEDELTSIGPPSELVAGTRWMHSVGRGRAVARIALGDRGGFEEDVRLVEGWFAETRNRGLGGQLARWRVTTALLDGRFDKVEALASDCLSLAPVQKDVWAIQMWRLALEQGRVDQYKDELLRVSAACSCKLLVLPMAAFAHTEVGEYDEARRILDAQTGDDFEHAGLHDTSTALAYFAEVTVALADAELAAQIFGLLLPYAGVGVVSGFSGVHCAGASDRYLGQLAATLGRWDEAERHYEAALDFEKGLRSPPLLARSRYWYGRMLLERGRPADADRARSLLTSTARTAQRLGMARLTTQATKLL